MCLQKWICCVKICIWYNWKKIVLKYAFIKLKLGSFTTFWVIYDSIKSDTESTGGLKCQNYTWGLLKSVRSNKHIYWCLSWSLIAELTSELDNFAATSKHAESGTLFGNHKSFWTEEQLGYYSVCQFWDCYQCQFTLQEAKGSRSRPFCHQGTKSRQDQVRCTKALRHCGKEEDRENSAAALLSARNHTA